MSKFKLFDNQGQPLPWVFNTRLKAQQFAAGYGRPDWIALEVILKKSTEKQQSAVKFCEEMLNVDFEGNIEDFYDVSEFLSEYLDDAKQLYEELSCEYEAYRMDLYD